MKKDKGPRFLLCENLQTEPDDFFVLHNRKPFVLVQINSELDIVSAKPITENETEKKIQIIEKQALDWVKQYIKDKKLQQ